jgi:signal peptide peptidase SppA
MQRLILALIFAIASICAPAYAADRPDILEVVALKGEVNQDMADTVTKRVAEINENQRVKAVLLDVDSPGGGVLESAEIYEELAKLKVPVVGYCENICASGGMYVLMSPTVKFIGVRTMTISGSIGVISHITRYNRLLEWAKIDSATYKSGVAKDTGNPARAETPEDTVELQGEINDLAGRFYALVEKSRGPKITPAALVQIKTARVFFGVDGVKIGLVDAVETREQIIAKAKDLSGSRAIYTREELKKMSKDAGAGSEDFGASATEPSMLRVMFDDLQYGVAWIKEIRAGENIRLEYRAPYAL